MTDEIVETWQGYREIPPRLNIAREVLDRRLEAGLGERTAFVFEGGSVSYAELGHRVNHLAHGLASIGIGKGTPVLIRLPNCLEFVVSFLALVKIGALPVLQNSLLGAEEVAYVRGHSEALAAITLDAIADPLRGLKAELPLGLIVARGAQPGEHAFETLIDNAPDAPFPTADTDANEQIQQHALLPKKLSPRRARRTQRKTTKRSHHNEAKSTKQHMSLSRTCDSVVSPEDAPNQGSCRSPYRLNYRCLQWSV